MMWRPPALFVEAAPRCRRCGCHIAGRLLLEVSTLAAMTAVRRYFSFRVSVPCSSTGRRMTGEPESSRVTANALVVYTRLASDFVRET